MINNSVPADFPDILNHIAQVLEERKTATPHNSYVAGLYAKGLDVILKKIGEEATETVIAAKNSNPQALVYEIADLWFHTLILLAQQNLGPQDVLNELARRVGISGLTEKAARQQSEENK